MASSQGLAIFNTIKADMDKATARELNLLAEFCKTRLQINVVNTCTKGYATGKLYDGIYARYQGTHSSYEGKFGYVVYGISSSVTNKQGIPYAAFVNNGTNPVKNTYMRYVTKDGVEIRTWSRKEVEGKHFMEKTWQDIPSH